MRTPRQAHTSSRVLLVSQSRLLLEIDPGVPSCQLAKAPGLEGPSFGPGCVRNQRKSLHPRCCSSPQP